MECKKCGEICIKKGKYTAVQKYYCTSCSSHQRISYSKPRITTEVMDFAIKLNNEGVGISSISRLLKIKKTKFTPYIFDNGDTRRQLLARSRFLLFKSPSKWTKLQSERARILFREYLSIQQTYQLTQKLSYIFENNTDKNVARLKLAKWYNEVEQAGFKSFNVISNTIYNNYEKILNYFNNRSTNASAESFNAKIKDFRRQFRGVKIFLFSCSDYVNFMLNF